MQFSLLIQNCVLFYFFYRLLSTLHAVHHPTQSPISQESTGKAFVFLELGLLSTSFRYFKVKQTGKSKLLLVIMERQTGAPESDPSQTKVGA